MELISDQSTSTVQYYYAMAKKWTNDLDYFSCESRYFHKLFDDFFLIYNSRLYHQELQELKSSLYELEKEKSETAKKLMLHFKNLEVMVNEKIAIKTEKIERFQVDMEYKVNGLIGRFGKIKKGLYDIVVQTQSTQECFYWCQ